MLSYRTGRDSSLFYCTPHSTECLHSSRITPSSISRVCNPPLFSFSPGNIPGEQHSSWWDIYHKVLSGGKDWPQDEVSRPLPVVPVIVYLGDYEEEKYFNFMKIVKVSLKRKSCALKLALTDFNSSLSEQISLSPSNRIVIHSQDVPLSGFKLGLNWENLSTDLWTMEAVHLLQFKTTGRKSAGQL